MVRMKKLCLLLALCVFLTGGLQTACAADALWMLPVSSQEGALLYAEPLEDSTLINTIAQGARVHVERIGIAWSYVQHGSLYGYVRTSELILGTNEETPFATVHAPSAGKLTLRKEASISSAAVDEVTNGRLVIVLNKGGQFTRVCYQGQIGYLLTAYLRFYTATEEAYTLRVVLPEGQGGSRVNLRESMQRASNSLMLIYEGTQVVVLERGEEWSTVEFNGTLGYMISEYLPLLE